MFLTMYEMQKIYEKIERGVATKQEKEQFEFNLLTGCFEREYVIEQLKNRQFNTEYEDEA